jgi:hypothetical protein
VIPLQRSEQLFEDTLLSVLENQPNECQIVGVHNGTYSDPFDLGDEVEFVTARSSNLVDLVRDANTATTAPIVHVLGTGMKVKSGWMDESLERFEDLDVAALTPSLTHDNAGTTRRAGWIDVGGRYCRPYEFAAGNPARVDNSAGNVRGFFLNACFIRQRLLASLLDAVAPAMNDPIAVSYAFGCLLKRAGWKVVVGSECQIEADQAIEFDDDSDFARGQRLAAIRSRILPSERSAGLLQMIQSALLDSSSAGEMIGMLRHRGNIAAIRRAIDLDSVSTVDQLACLLKAPRFETQHRRAA